MTKPPTSVQPRWLLHTENAKRDVGHEPTQWPGNASVKTPIRLQPHAWLRLLACWFGLVWVSVGTWSADTPASLEYKVKAGYLFNFAKFIEWPASSLPLADSPFVIGVLDDGEALPTVKSVLEGKKVDGHPVQVKAVASHQLGMDLQILLVTRMVGKTPEELRTALNGAATLLVGETEQFAERGGMVGFTREEESIRLSLNLERATAAGLKISSKLSSVAKQVKTKRDL